MSSSWDQIITLTQKPAVYTVPLRSQLLRFGCAFNNCYLCFSRPCTSSCRLCIEQIDDVVEEEEDELTQAARLNSHAEASSSEAKVVKRSVTQNAIMSLCVTCHGV